MITRPQLAAILCALTLSSSCRSGDPSTFSPESAFSIAETLARQAREAESSTTARDAEIETCPDSVSLSRATPGHLAADYAVLMAVADGLKSQGFECALRTTTRRSTQRGVVRVDQARDLVAWRPRKMVQEVSRTVAVVVSIDGTPSGDSIVGGLWPAALTLEALSKPEVSEIQNPIVVTIGSSNEWGVLNRVVPGDPPTAAIRRLHAREIEVAGPDHPAAPVVSFESPGWMIGFVPGAVQEMDFPFPTVHRLRPPTPSDTPGNSISTSSASAFAQPTMNVVQSIRIDADEERQSLLSATANRFFTALRTADGREERSDFARSMQWMLVMVLPAVLLAAAALVVYHRARVRLERANNAIRRMESWLAVSARLGRWHDACLAVVRENEKKATSKTPSRVDRETLREVASSIRAVASIPRTRSRSLRRSRAFHTCGV